MPVVASSAYNTAGQITSLVRSLLNDAAGNLFTDGVLLPYANAAYHKVQRALGNVQAGSFLNDDVLLVVSAVTAADPSVQVSITFDTTAPPNQLPTDLLVPLKLWERPNGSCDDFIEMTDLSKSRRPAVSAAGSQPLVLGVAHGGTFLHWRHARYADPAALSEGLSGFRGRHQPCIGP